MIVKRIKKTKFTVKTALPVLMAVIMLTSCGRQAYPENGTGASVTDTADGITVTGMDTAPSELCIGEKIMSEYTIYYAPSAEKADDAAALLAERIGEVSGKTPEIKAAGSGPVSESAIVIGNTGGATAASLTEALSGKIPFSVTFDNGILYLSGKDYWGLTAAVNYIYENYISTGTNIPSDLAYSGEAAKTYIFGRTPGTSLRIMTNNCWNRDATSEDWTKLGANCSADVRSIGLSYMYLAFRPDIICFQEMTPWMMKLLKYELSSAGVNYEILRREAKDFTSILYNPETVKLLDSGFHLFEYGNDSSSKGYTWGYFEHIATGQKFIALSTHWWWKSDTAEAGSSEMRRRQAAEIVELSKELETKYGCPIFVQGDFNTTCGTAAFKELINGGFEDCHDIAASADNTSGYHTCTPKTFNEVLSSGSYSQSSIDHMTVKNLGSWSVSAFRQPVSDFYWRLSDHIPVYIDVKIE